MHIYEQMVLLTNNLGEKNVLFGLTENYILRLLDKANILDRDGKTLRYPELQTSFFSGSIHYGVNTFVTHIQNITDPVVGSQKYFSDKGNLEEHVILTAINSFNVRIAEAFLKSGKEREKMVIDAIYELLADKRLRSTLDSYAFDPKNPKKRISASLLPTSEEFGGNGFRNVFFNYIRKGEEAMKQAKGKGGVAVS